MADPKKSPASQPLAGDDRNLVAIGEESAGLTFEDRVYLFWNNYKGVVVGGALVLLLAVVAKTSWEVYEKSKEAAIADAYAAISDTKDFPAFIAAHPKHPLAAVAQIRIADEHYQADRSAEAAEAYLAAASILPASDPLGARARLGAAMSQLRAKELEKGRQALASLADDTSALASFRAQAAYQHAVSLGESGDTEAAIAAIEKAISLDKIGSWAQRAQNLRRVVTMPRATTAVSVVPAAEPAVSGPILAAPTEAGAPASEAPPAPPAEAPVIEFKPSAPAP